MEGTEPIFSRPEAAVGSQGSLLLLCSSQESFSSGCFFPALSALPSFLTIPHSLPSYPIPSPTTSPARLREDFSSLILVTFSWIIICWERRSVLLIIGCLAESLLYPLDANSTLSCNQKCLQTLQMSPGRQNHPIKSHWSKQICSFGLVRESEFGNSFLRGRTVLHSDQYHSPWRQTGF